MSKLLDKAYTVTFSVIFGIFISMMPNIIKNDAGGYYAPSFLAIVIVLLGFLFTFYLGDFKKNNERIKKLFTQKSEKD